MFSYVFLINGHEKRLKYHLLKIFIFIQWYLVHLLLEECALKSKHVTKFNFFTTVYIRACDALVNVRFNYQLKIFTIPNLKRLNNKSFDRILLLLSDDISLNPGPKNNLHPLNLNVWSVFISKGPQLLLKYQQPSSAN